MLLAQAPTFDAVSIKRHVGPETGRFMGAPLGQFVGKSKLLVIDHIERPLEN